MTARPNPKTPVQIAIAGAGLTALVMARTLSRLGIDVEQLFHEISFLLLYFRKRTMIDVNHFNLKGSFFDSACSKAQK